MTIKIFIMLFTAYAIISPLITIAIKKFLDDTGKKYASDIVVLIISAIVSICGTALYYSYVTIPFTAINIAFIAVLWLFVWVGSMVGYKQVKEAIEQIIALKSDSMKE
jgi:hypothetical protein